MSLWIRFAGRVKPRNGSSMRSSAALLHEEDDDDGAAGAAVDAAGAARVLAFAWYMRRQSSSVRLDTSSEGCSPFGFCLRAGMAESKEKGAAYSNAASLSYELHGKHRREGEKPLQPNAAATSM